MGIYNSNCDFNKYKVFYAVAECNSFSRATEVLHITQPAISYAIKELEKQLETKLFIRNKNSIKLTDDGEKLMYYVQKAFNSILKGEKVLTEKEQEITGVIRIGIYSHISLFMLPKIIKEFSEMHPNAKISVVSSTNHELKEMLKHKEVDFIVLQYPIFLTETVFKEEVLCSMESCFFGTKKFYDLYLNNDSISNVPMVLPFDGYTDIDSLEEIFKKHNLVIKNNIRSYTTSLLKELVKQNLGIGWGLKKLIEKELKEKEFYEIPVDIEIPNTIYSIAYDEKFLSETARAFIKYFKEHIDEVIKIS